MIYIVPCCRGQALSRLQVIQERTYHVGHPTFRGERHVDYAIGISRSGDALTEDFLLRFLVQPDNVDGLAHELLKTLLICFEAYLGVTSRFVQHQGTGIGIGYAGFARGFYNLGQGYSPCAFEVRVLWVTKEFLLDDVSGGIVGFSRCPDPDWFVKPVSLPPIGVVPCQVVCRFYRTAVRLAYPISCHQDALGAVCARVVKLGLVIVGLIPLEPGGKLPVLFLFEKL